MRNYDSKIASKLSLRPTQVAATIRLLDEGNTIPFIARYRKELTDGLDEEQLRQLHDLLDSLRKVDDRRDTIIHSIEAQGKMTPDLLRKIEAAETLTELEDIYQPHKPKRRTRASIARERGLEPLANLILEQPRTSQPAHQFAQPYVNEDVPDIESAFAGAQDIIAEVISDHDEIRGTVRSKALSFGRILTQKIEGADDEKGVYHLYYAFDYRINSLKPHQILALNRGEAEKILHVKMDLSERDWRDVILRFFRPDSRSPLSPYLEAAIEDGAKRLLLPAIERDVRSVLTEQASEHAIQVFASNLQNLLNQPPLVGHTVMGIDPGFRTGCKVAIVDPMGKVLETTTIYPHPPQKQWNEALRILHLLIDRFNVTLLTIGNGTASRETEQLAAELTRSRNGTHYLIVNEAGASVYSASELARRELPDLDVSLRGAVSIARRAQDPLAELVKIDPKSIGVGMYQHDVNQTRLTAALDAVVETVVNRVGVDVNTASPALLTYVAGIGPKLAQNIVTYRDENGAFLNRKALKKVPGLGLKAFEQSAGFLRIRDGDNPLDVSAIHPESYDIAKAVLSKAGLKANTPVETRTTALAKLREQQSIEKLAQELNVGVPTLIDIFEQLVRPGRDPREELPPPVLRSDVLSMEDLREGMILRGTVRNVVDFGAFIDIGVKQDGLLHRSQIPRGISPAVGDIIDVEVLQVEIQRGRISLGWAE
ncbi:MAG: RNA-binding transcriptional accessory protein [Anaerolineae bacterium]|nr:MAG: RNA-binding transcriptional accessory protein [Anaerolineae bacterium]